MKDGTLYFPSEVYPKFGIEPFGTAPTVKQAEARKVSARSADSQTATQEGTARNLACESDPPDGVPLTDSSRIVGDSENAARVPA